MDNPLKSLEKHQEFNLETDLCPDVMDLLGVWEGDFVKIGYVLVLERRAKYTVYGRIEHIVISYEDYTVKIKGKVIKNLQFLPPDAIQAPTPPTEEQGFDFEYGYTNLDTTGEALEEIQYVLSVNDGVIESGSEENKGDNITVQDFGNSVDKVLFIQVPATEAPFTMWSEVGNPLQQDQPIDNSFAGSNVWFRSIYQGDTIYLTRSQTSFGGAIILKR
jgi:hypothetical protein